jgi:hypothetical protein
MVRRIIAPARAYLRGAATVLDLSGQGARRTTTKSPEQLDAEAIRSDWLVVGYDLRASARTIASRVQ